MALSRSRKQNVNRRRHGGAAVVYNPATMDYKLEAMSLKQGQEAQELTKQFHGGAAVALGGAPYAEALAGKDGLSADMLGPARMEKLEGAMGEIKGMTDQAGGKRRRNSASRKGRKTHRNASRKGRKASRKASRKTYRKASRKGRKASRKDRKASRKGRKASRKASRKAGRKSRMVYRKSRKASRKSMRGGAASFADSAAPVGEHMDLGINPKAAGLNQEWHDVAAQKGGDYMGPRVAETYRSDMP